MKVLTVVGARPQFIKAAVLSRALLNVLTPERTTIAEVLVHTGQHYSPRMSDVFFDALGLAPPRHHLGIGSAPHGIQTGRMLAALEPVVQAERPDAVLVYGDTNSTLAGALVASKLHIPVAHVEAGLRSFNRCMPEEINRVLTDHVSTLLFAPTRTAVDNLAAEGITRGVHEVGDVMLDAARSFAAIARPTPAPLTRGGYLLATLHRAENTDNPGRLAGVLAGLAAAANASNRPVWLPLHPRTRAKLEQFNLTMPTAVHATEPVDYLEMLGLMRDAAVILTDSGGVQKEAFFLGRPCVTLRDETEWVETVRLGWNVLVGADPGTIQRAVEQFLREPPAATEERPFGDGAACQTIANLLAARVWS